MNLIVLAQIAVSAILITLILFQQRGSGLGSAFGQEGGAYATRRGIQKKIFYATIVFAVLFVALALYTILF